MMNNNIPQGYKMSPLGVIPQDWEVRRLGEVCKSAKLGGNYENSTEVSNIPLIKMGNIGRGKMQIDKIQYLRTNEPYDTNDILQYGDLLFNTRNTLDLVGKVAIWRNELPFALYNSNLLRLVFKDEYISNNFFANYLLNSARSIVSLRGYATGTTSVAAIYNRDLMQLKMALPPLAEQERIAEVLGTWDEAIDKQSQLVKALERRKRALMQQLLTARKRLPNFSTPWQSVKFGEIAKAKKGVALSSKDLKEGVYPVIAGGKTSPYSHSSYTNENIITISASGAYAGYVSYHQNKIWASDCSIVDYIKGVSAIEYLYHLLTYRQEEIYALQSGGAQPHVFPKDIVSIKCIVPPLEEQKAIAQIITTADKEIELATKKLDTLRTQKRALMQQLLTGKKRLKI